MLKIHNFNLNSKIKIGFSRRTFHIIISGDVRLYDMEVRGNHFTLPKDTTFCITSGEAKLLSLGWFGCEQFFECNDEKIFIDDLDIYLEDKYFGKTQELIEAYRQGDPDIGKIYSEREEILECLDFHPEYFLIE